jgi:lactobin A/cerein 7B family class IIb bacteriocin
MSIDAMKTLNSDELDRVSGGLLPVVAYGIYFGSGAVGTFVASFGFAVGAEKALREKK